MIAENSISFDTEWKENMNFPVDEMLTFASEINEYMNKAYILVSVVDGKLCYSTTDKIESYQMFTKNKNIRNKEDLRKNLEEYKSKLETNQL